MIDFLLNPAVLTITGWIIFFLTPLVALIALVLLTKYTAWLLRNAFFWMAGLSGPLLVLLWLLFNLITERFGLDSLFGLCLNLLIFTLIGLAIGALLRFTGSTLLPPSCRSKPKDLEDSPE